MQEVQTETMHPSQDAEADLSNEIIPDTPERSFGREIQNNIVETPRKHNRGEHKLITLLGSVGKTTPISKLRGRAFELSKKFSPTRKQNILKRHVHDSSQAIGSKLMKMNDACTIPKARAALFQDKKDEFIISTKSFYGSSEKKAQSFHYSTLNNVEQIKRRHSLPILHLNSRRLLKKARLSGINAGVCHGVKKPKSKPIVDKSKERITENTPPSPEIDITKRFFKFNRRANIQNPENKKVKLKVNKGTVQLNENNASLSHNKYNKPKIQNNFYDTMDLTVDEPEIQTSLPQTKVADLLKILEDDWADDDETIELLTNHQRINAISPLKPVAILSDATVSPASELTTMTSVMNIEDIRSPRTLLNNSVHDVNSDEPSLEKNRMEVKYYPMFTKGYSPGNIYKDNDTVKSESGTKKSVKWQLSAKYNGGEDQYQLDVGQKKFGATQCSECNIVYQVGDPEDENAHLTYHNSMKTLVFNGWKKERVVSEDYLTSSRIILIKPGDCKQYWKKVLDVLAVVDRELGLVDTKLNNYEDKDVYLYVRAKNILGVLIAENINSAHRMIPDLIDLDCCTAESTPAKCGINVVWTVMSHRRQHIATKLLDTVRANFYYGYIMTIDDIAFSTPTPSGKLFAEKYTKTRTFKVYN